ncbi:MAG: ATP-binding protein, partial [Coriobacteriia bacterium]|nr:ATP-binding protein [Coriobacteriia bacterium]
GKERRGQKNLHTNRDLTGVLAFALLRARRAQTRARAANEQLAVVNQDLARALELAESASQAKTRFLNSMSHDIRTPMNAVMGYATIARKRNQDAGVGDCLDKISSSSEHLLTLINDVLDTSRIESGKVVISPEPVDLGNVTQTVADIARGFIAGRDLDFQVNAAAAESTWALADAARIRDVLVNILGNAVKFTPDGGTVRFDFELLPGADESHVLARYRVADTGVGMSPEFLEHLFDEFSQEEQGARTSYKGTGLGMAIVKRYVDMMGGTVAVESTKGAGSTFTVELPLERCRQEDLEEPAQPATAVSLEGVRVLMAEDNDLNAEIATIQLEEAGMAVTRARDGQEALELFCNSQEGSFDAILMDVMMPRMDGHEATRAIRSLSRSDASLPIVAMTANAFAEDARACREAGMDDHLAKPMAMDQVLEVLGSCLGKRGHRMP